MDNYKSKGREYGSNLGLVDTQDRFVYNIYIHLWIDLFDLIVEALQIYKLDSQILVSWCDTVYGNRLYDRI